MLNFFMSHDRSQCELVYNETGTVIHKRGGFFNLLKLLMRVCYCYSELFLFLL